MPWAMGALLPQEVPFGQQFAGVRLAAPPLPDQPLALGAEQR